MAQWRGLWPYFFEIPVYFESKEQHSSGMAKKLEQFKRSVGDQALAESLFSSSRWYSWEFNDVVGWVALCVDGHGVRAHLYMPDAETIRRRPRGSIVLRSELFEEDFSYRRSASSGEIFASLMRALKNVGTSEGLLKRRYIDLTAFEICGQAIDWRALLALR